jgi:hypothetical protein
LREEEIVSRVSTSARTKTKVARGPDAGKEASYAGIGDAAVRAKTGKGWNDWFAILDRTKASTRPHGEIAAFLHEEHGVPGWWCQMVTVGYEQARGLRERNQKASGFAASSSKTIAVPVEKLFDAWDSPTARSSWLGSMEIAVRKATRPKSMRISWADGSSVHVNFSAKGPAKSQVAIEHEKLKSAADVARMKETWGGALERLKGKLEGTQH